MDSKPRILVIWHSQTGNAKALATAAAEGATAEGGDVQLLHAMQAGISTLLWAEGLIIATPENFGALSGLVKDFFDRTYYPAEGKTVGLPWALMVACGNDGRGAVAQAERIATGYRWKSIADALLVRGAVDTRAKLAARETGVALVAGLRMGIF